MLCVVAPVAPLAAMSPSLVARVPLLVVRCSLLAVLPLLELAALSKCRLLTVVRRARVALFLWAVGPRLVATRAVC